MDQKTVTAKVLDRNLDFANGIAAYKVEIKNYEYYFEAIIRPTPNHFGGIDEDDARQIMNGDLIEISVKETDVKDAYDIIDIKPIKEKKFHRRNLLVMRS